jgi:hypothetical protein
MPHFLNILKVKPLQILITEALSSPKALASLQLTRVEENPLHCQLIVVRFVG